MNKKTTLSIVLSFALVVGLGSSIYLVNSTNQDTRSRAATDIEIKNKSLQNTLKTPYIRLVPRSIVVKKDMVVPVDIVMHTGGVVLSEVVLGLEYDPSKVLLKDDGVEGGEVLSVVNVEQIQAGKVYFSVFRGEPTSIDPTVYIREVVVATVYAQIIGDSGVVTIKPISDGDLKTTMYGERDPSSGEVSQFNPNLGEAEILLSSK